MLCTKIKVKCFIGRRGWSAPQNIQRMKKSVQKIQFLSKTMAKQNPKLANQEYASEYVAHSGPARGPACLFYIRHPSQVVREWQGQRAFLRPSSCSLSGQRISGLCLEYRRRARGAWNPPASSSPAPRPAKAPHSQRLRELQTRPGPCAGSATAASGQGHGPSRQALGVTSSTLNFRWLSSRKHLGGFSVTSLGRAYWMQRFFMSLKSWI